VPEAQARAGRKGAASQSQLPSAGAEAQFGCLSCLFHLVWDIYMATVSAKPRPTLIETVDKNDRKILLIKSRQT